MTLTTSGAHTVVGGNSHDANQHLFTAGAPLNTSTGCSGNPCAQQLYLKLTGSLPSTTSQKLLNPDGSSLRGSSPPSGDGETSASAERRRRRGDRRQRPDGRGQHQPDREGRTSRRTTVTIGGDFFVTSSLSTKTHANTENGSGGLVAIPDVDSSIVGTDNNSRIHRQHDLHRRASAAHGIEGDDGPGTAQVDGTGITITAGGNVKLAATTFITSSIRAHTDSGGAGDFSNASAFVQLRRQHDRDRRQERRT